MIAMKTKTVTAFKMAMNDVEEDFMLPAVMPLLIAFDKYHSIWTSKRSAIDGSCVGSARERDD
jgi:hypothetical protein